MNPLQFPTPPELLVIVLLIAILFGIPLGVIYLLRRRKRRVNELNQRVDELESQLE